MNDTLSTTPGPAPATWTRRALVGGAVLVAGAAAAGAWRAIDTGMVLQGDEAFHPWQAWRASASGDPLSLVAAAVLASNPHNTQPWSFRVSATRIDVRADAARGLGAFDPFGREMWHGLGAAIANIEIAAPARGFEVATELVPDPIDAALAARIHLRARPDQASALASVIDQRRTNRAAYDPGSAIPTVLQEAIGVLDDDAVRTRWLPAVSTEGRLFARDTVEATRQINADAEMVEAGHRWFRANPRQVAMHRDGVSTPTAGISPLVATLSPLAPPVDGAEAGHYWLRSTQMQLASAPMYGLLLVRDLDDRRLQLLAGARWQRMHLLMTQAGLAGHPMNQLVEIVDRDRQLRRPSPTAQSLAVMAGDAAWKPTFAFRTGFATREVPHSARRPVAAVVTT